MAGRGRRGRGGEEGGGARAAPLKRAAARAGAAQPWSEPESGRACVCLCFAPARSSASRGDAAKVCGVFGFSPSPWPCRLRAPLPPPLLTEGPSPGKARAAPLSPLRPRAERVNVGPRANGLLSLPEKKERGKKGGKQLSGYLQRVEPSSNGHFGGLCGLFSRGRRVLHPLPCKSERRGQVGTSIFQQVGKHQVSRAARKPGPARSSPPGSRCCHLDSFPLHSSPLKTLAGEKSGAHTESRGGKREAPGPAQKQIRSHREGGRPAAQLRRLPGFLLFRNEGGGLTIPRGAGAGRGGGAQPRPRRGAPAAAAARLKNRLSACALLPSTFLLLPSTSRAAAAAAQSYRHTQGAST